MNHLSLFTGIGGMDLGLERAGMTTVGQVEIDDYCRDVLARHWPTVPRHDDVRTAVEWWRGQGTSADVVSGGFPCQPFSHAGHKVGVNDDRYLWPAMRAVVKEVMPRYVIVENVIGLLRSPAFGEVLTDLAALGYVVEWSAITACAVGAPHVRRRLFIVAYPDGEHGSQGLAGPLHDAAPIRPARDGKHAWRDSRVWLAATRRNGRVAGRLTARMVAAGGNAVVPAVAERVGRLVMAHAGRAPA